MLHPWAKPSSTPSVLPRVPMVEQTTARFFLCARCRQQVLVCRHCDRGQRYCADACAAMTRGELQRQAGVRYQRSRAGRFKHALRTRRWRARRLAAPTKIVTHQGSPCPAPDDLLGAAQTLTLVTKACTATTLISSRIALGPHLWRCHWCCVRCAALVRQGFLGQERRPRHGHSP